MRIDTRVACDSLVALANSTLAGSVVFAKNSDRPAGECQPLVLLPAQSYRPSSSLRCTYIEVPQVERTSRVLGSRPYWCWGFEHGLNEHGVAIGNHTVFTKDTLEGQGLIGMDLVRLGLERSADAEAAVLVITSLLQTYGQGGSGYADKDWPYHNSFLIADRHTAFVLETSGQHWATRRVVDTASVSNHLSIGSDWTALSPHAESHAIAQGWWQKDGRRFDFAAAYRDTSMAPEIISSGRYASTCAWLGSNRQQITDASLRAALRDHYGSATPRADTTPDQPQYFSVCMHAEPVGTTTASMIAPIDKDASLPLLYWAGLGSPCVGVFLPLFVDCEVPPALSAGGEQSSEHSAWWQFKNLLTLVELDWQMHLPRVRAVFDDLEAKTLSLLSDGRLRRASTEQRQEFIDRTTSEALKAVRRLLEQLA